MALDLYAPALIEGETAINKKLPEIIKIITGIILIVSLAACATVGPAGNGYSRAEFVAKISDYFA